MVAGECSIIDFCLTGVGSVSSSHLVGGAHSKASVQDGPQSVLWSSTGSMQEERYVPTMQ